MKRKSEKPVKQKAEKPVKQKSEKIRKQKPEKSAKRTRKAASLKSKKGIVAGGIALTALVVLAIVVVSKDSPEEAVYREAVVQYGNLVVGVTESGSVDIGTQSQVFELDMGALVRAETGNSNTGSVSGNGYSTGMNAAGNTGGASGSFGGSMGGMAGGSFGGASGGNGGNYGSAGSGTTGGNAAGNSGSTGMGSLNLFGQFFGMAGGNGSNDTKEDVGNLTVAQVCVAVGQQVAEGDILYLLEEDSVSELEQELQSNVEKAKADLDAVYADQALAGQQAKYTYESSIAYGDYAETEYDTSVRLLEEAVADAEAALEKANVLLEGYREQLAQADADYEDALQILRGCEWSRDNTDKWEDTGDYVMYFQMAQTAQSTVDSLEQKKEQLERNVEQAQKNVETYTSQLNTAKRNLASGRLTAQETLQLRRLACTTAAEAYDIAMAYLEDNAMAQEEVYAKAKENWEEFSSHIDGNAIRARYNGVITSVDMEVGDRIGTNDTLVTLYDMGKVGMTVSVDEEDMTDIELGSRANISLIAYPNQIFQAAVTDISDAFTDSNGKVAYDVTATLEGDVSGLFQGMTGDITFVTRETRNVLYVSNRAITRDGIHSYVKIMDEKGNIRRQEVTVGFSDGINVEIVEGLSEGDVVLIESRVSED